MAAQSREDLDLHSSTLVSIVESSTHADVKDSIHAHLTPSRSNSIIREATHKLTPWVKKFDVKLEDLTVKHHAGNYVINRDTGEKFFESMPIYARY
jgi:phosphatidylserine decarboxylase